MGRLRNDAEATFEFHLFNGIQGVVKAPKDGATVINYYTEFGITPAAEVDFDLDNQSPASGALRQLPIAPRVFALATPVRVSAEGGSFTGGALWLACHIISIGAPA